MNCGQRNPVAPTTPSALADRPTDGHFPLIALASTLPNECDPGLPQFAGLVA